MYIKDSNIAVVHDWFKKSFGGSEKVTLLSMNY